MIRNFDDRLLSELQVQKLKQREQLSVLTTPRRKRLRKLLVEHNNRLMEQLPRSRLCQFV
jgi:hypothetical protein